ncbi:hypothetical protein T439DRAFT_322107 [Meredithblackwellia eburnea MCA 4105]
MSTLLHPSSFHSIGEFLSAGGNGALWGPYHAQRAWNEIATNEDVKRFMLSIMHQAAYYFICGPDNRVWKWRNGYRPLAIPHRVRQEQQELKLGQLTDIVFRSVAVIGMVAPLGSVTLSHHRPAGNEDWYYQAKNLVLRVEANFRRALLRYPGNHDIQLEVPSPINWEPRPIRPGELSVESVFDLGDNLPSVMVDVLLMMATKTCSSMKNAGYYNSLSQEDRRVISEVQDMCTTLLGNWGQERALNLRWSTFLTDPTSILHGCDPKLPDDACIKLWHQLGLVENRRKFIEEWEDSFSGFKRLYLKLVLPEAATAADKGLAQKLDLEHIQNSMTERLSSPKSPASGERLHQVMREELEIVKYALELSDKLLGLANHEPGKIKQDIQQLVDKMEVLCTKKHRLDLPREDDVWFEERLRYLFALVASRT